MDFGTYKKESDGNSRIEKMQFGRLHENWAMKELEKNIENLTSLIKL